MNPFASFTDDILFHPILRRCPQEKAIVVNNYAVVFLGWGWLSLSMQHVTTVVPKGTQPPLQLSAAVIREEMSAM